MSRISNDLGHFKNMPNDTLNSTKKISVFDLKKKGYFKPLVFCITGTMRWHINGQTTGKIKFDLNLKGDGEVPRPYMKLEYRIKYLQGWMPYYDKFELIKTPCPFGGARWFFKCWGKVGQYCGRKVAILYLVNGHFVCRHCANLSYDSCNKSKKSREIFHYGSFLETLESYSNLKRYSYRKKPTLKHRSYLKKVDKHIGKYISLEKKRSIINYIDML